MRVHYRKRNESVWKVIPNVDTPIAISDVANDTFDSVKISFFISETHSDFSNLKNMKPKTYIRVTDTNNDNDINERNTYYFLTTQLPKGKIRNKVKNDSDVVTTPELWQIEITGLELIKETEDTNMPNYTITQPKTQFFNRYRRILTDRYTFTNTRFDYSSATLIPLGSNSKMNVNQANVGGVITTQYDSGNLLVRLNNASEESYSINFTIGWQKTAHAIYERYFKDVYSLKSNNLGQPLTDPDTRVQFITYYYDSSNNIITSLTTSENLDIHYKGDLVSKSGNVITSLAGLKTNSVQYYVDKKEGASYSITHIQLLRKFVAKNYIYRATEDVVYTEVTTNISGFSNNSYVKCQIDTIELDITSSQITDELIETKQTLLEFVEKAIWDYNFNHRKKLTLANDTRMLLDVFAKESEWSGYNFRELLVRAFKYVNAVPYLTIDGAITAIKPNETSFALDIEEQTELNETIVDDDYYDVVVSNAKNLVSDDDFTIETAVVGSGSDEFVQVTTDNATFRFTTPIYYISKAILYMPNVTFNIPLNYLNIPINTNMGVPYYWDITSRVLDNNFYKALPNVNFTSKVGRSSSQLSQANTLSFVSGDKNVERLGHRGANIPTFGIFSSNPATQTQFAIFEALICLAYEWILNNTTYDVNDFVDNYNPENLDLAKMLGAELQLTFVPYHKELTTKYISSNFDRKGLNYQKKVNVSDRTIDYKENELILIREMNRKGNTSFITPFIQYKSLGEVMPVGSIINNGQYVVTSRRILLYNDFVEAEYTIDKELINQNTDVGLSVEYSPYNVPYEYVQREMFIDNHLIFSKTTTSDYGSEPKGCESALLEDIFVPNNSLDRNTSGEIYARMRMSYVGANKFFLMKLNKLTSKFSMVLSGKFIDNYSSGTQRYVVPAGGGGELHYSQPYSYTDYKGQVNIVGTLSIGYNPQVKYRLSNSYDYTKFPLDNGTFTRNYIPSYGNIILKKDSREALALNYHSYLETISEDVRFYNFMPINAIGTLRKDIPLSDDLTIENAPIGFYLDIPLSVTITSIANNGYRFDFEMPTESVNSQGASFTNGIVLLNVNNKEINIVGIIKKPTVVVNPISTTISTYVYSTRYGIK